ncbi:hypothetical protein OsI_27740 [Oryza sativa Indica Group]|uniref:Uncharacterized protein n=1 Tax=Oryza sativa subsp. indica TaxID=39946 RepID=A2YR11_ORYSI|nr:hypothetical protein OsI_27740 [Oryza sativa Indica Group]
MCVAGSPLHRRAAPNGAPDIATPVPVAPDATGLLDSATTTWRPQRRRPTSAPPRRHLEDASRALRLTTAGRHQAPAASAPAAQGLLPLFQAPPPHLQAATIAALGRWSSYLYMATNVVVQAVGPATSSSMIHRQRRCISLDYISLFSSNCALLRQFSLYAVLTPRPSWKPSLLASLLQHWHMIHGGPLPRPRYWQHRCMHSSRVVPGSGKPSVTSRPSRFDYISSSASSSSTTVAIVSPSSSPAPLVHDTLPCVHDHSTTPHALPAARLPRHQLPDFGYIDHDYSTHGYLDHGSLAPIALATSTTTQRAIIRINEHSCQFLL